MRRPFAVSGAVTPSKHRFPESVQTSQSCTATGRQARHHPQALLPPANAKLTRGADETPADVPGPRTPRTGLGRSHLGGSRSHLGGSESARRRAHPRAPLDRDECNVANAIAPREAARR
jgi:hypothetical protein